MKTSLRLLFGSLTLALGIGLAQAQPTILLVSDNAYVGSRAGTGDPELDFVMFLTNLGYQVERATGAGTTAQFRENNGGSAAAAAVGADLIIVSRVTDSGNYDEGNAGAGWNSITTPLLLMGPHIARDSRWRWLPSGVIDQGNVTGFNFTQPTHPFVNGLNTDLFDTPTSLTRVGTTSAGNGNLIATTPDGDVGLIEWGAGQEFYAGSGQFAGGQRVYMAGLRYHEDDGLGQPIFFNSLNANGQALLAQTIMSMVPVPEPGTIGLMIIGGAGALVAFYRRRRA